MLWAAFLAGEGSGHDQCYANHPDNCSTETVLTTKEAFQEWYAKPKWAEWIPTKERMPSVGTEVLALAKHEDYIDGVGDVENTSMHVAHYTKCDGSRHTWWTWGKDYGFHREIPGRITHWMPLPEIPIESASVDAPA